MQVDLTNARVHRLRLAGTVEPLVALRKATGRPGFARPMGGWLMTYGQLAEDGTVVPTRDRDGQITEAARELGRIDWSGYLTKGVWNDTHLNGKVDDKTGIKRPRVIVGMPDSLEFHDGTTELSKAHRKVGFFTTGRLFDRTDPASWEGLGRFPTDHEFSRADHFWELAHLLKGTPRPIALSADGLMALSPCGGRITYAAVEAAAVCELPRNPDATLESLLDEGSPFRAMRKGTSAGGSPCGACRCSPGACAGLGLLEKAGVRAGGATVPEDLEGHKSPALVKGPEDAPEGPELLRLLVDRVMHVFHVDAPTAVRWIKLYTARATGRDTGETDAHR